MRLTTASVGSPSQAVQAALDVGYELDYTSWSSGGHTGADSGGSLRRSFPRDGTGGPWLFRRSPTATG